MRGLYQALAVASMCVQEQAAARPLIGDVVTALSYLANRSYDSTAQLGQIEGGSGSNDERGGGRILRKELLGGSARRWDFERSEKEDSPRETVNKIVNLSRNAERDRAVAEAKMWGENWREKRRQGAQGSFDGLNG